MPPSTTYLTEIIHDGPDADVAPPTDDDAPDNPQATHRTDTDKRAATAEDSPTNLPDKFWSSRGYLTHIRRAAHSRTLSADSVLGCVLARVAILTPPTVQLPAIVAATATLDLLIALVADSGVGKSASTHVAADLLPIIDETVVLDFPVGSGEGIVDAYLGQIEELNDHGKKVRVRRQTKRAVLAVIDEGQVLAEFANRKGSTLMPTLRSAWSGSTLGQGNASAETNRKVQGGRYRFAAIIAVQPAHAASLLADAAGGTPQRILWLTAQDPTIPDEAPQWPGPIAFLPPTHSTLAAPMKVDDDINHEIRARKLARSRGKHKDADPLDSHADLLRLKIAALLAILDERLNVNADDWELARMVMSTSQRVRTVVVMHAQLDARHREEAATGKAIRREVALSGSAESRALDKAARAVGKRAHRTPGEQLTRREFSHGIASRDRQLTTVDDAIAEAIRQGWIEKNGDTFTAGKKMPQ